jgi:hypothetical protein
MRERLARKPARGRARLLAIVATLLLAGAATSAALAELPTTDDPRATLSPGLNDAGVAALGVELLGHVDKTAGFSINSDLAFEGDHAFVGSFEGFQIYDISDPASPVLRTAVVCPGGQGEVSVYGNLLFMSAEEARARTDCGAPSVPSGDPRRFRGVRIFDISNLDAPVQVAAVQTCRGSHTHTLLKSPHDDENLYVYVSGTGGVRSTAELASCKALPQGTPLTTPQTDETLSQWRIEVIRVPLAAPQDAAVVADARLMRDEATGVINGLQNAPPTLQHPSGTNWSPSPTSDSCHDITVMPAIDLAAGACEGNGLLIDISDPAHPVRIDFAADPNYAYWHGATFSNDGTKVVFTDEWGGGTQPRCRATDDLAWGANAIYEIVDRKLVFRSYYKLPVAQTTRENCVGHLPSLVPVPGRDVMTQAWYQGGLSLVDFTDPANPHEIGYWDRGPISADSLVLGGLWSTYYYNGAIYGSEIARGFDAWRLTPTPQLSQNEIDAAAELQLERLTPQHQPRLVNEPSFAVVRSYRDQLVRAEGIDATTLGQVDKFVDRAERYSDEGQDAAAKAQLNALANQLEGAQYDDLRAALRALADA